MRTPVVLIACLCALAALAGGCKNNDFSPSFEAFSRNRLAVLARNMETTRDAQKEASDQITQSVATIKKDAWTGADPGDAYDLARRLDSASETRVRNAHSRLKVLKTSGEDFFDQWSKETSEYEDKDLRESSRQNRLKVKAAFDAAIDQMQKAEAATEPALAAIRDQVLFLKHHRNAAAVPDRPSHSADPALPAEALARATQAAAQKADEFAESVRPSPK